MSIFKGFNPFSRTKAKVEAAPAQGSAEEQAAAAALFARTMALPPERLQVHDQLMEIRSRLREDSRLGPRERSIEDRRFQTFALSFAETPDIDFTKYAANPESFRKQKLDQQFKLSVFALTSTVPYEPGREYTTREGSTKEPLSGQSQYLDAPYAFALGYEKEEGKWEILSTISFLPDYSKQIVVIDQVQGGDTARHRATPIGKRIRLKFSMETQPELILYEAVLDLALRAGYRGVKLRKAEKNQWGKVSQDKIADDERRLTPYDRLASLRKLKEDTHNTDYYFEPVVSPAAEMPLSETHP